ncbi:retromer complex subunit Vps17 [Schizosaccharomyces pombe]|uniref:Vacuolar protein sorting-associated protein 17 n=1 Tax=Schizosaccharomyces pombe (strain 972 / ATCC 24843) TaxID=284812 RepID=VPS17_SCHPO|nr:retromer complex subunit Vps17 [Schizosaccharomyces pombe]Q9URW7.1 RecName: Full=Vacuolar protein sorting-associated protein 17 [Schizosaccharomyces pombe 972h-]CAB62421.1 retromer complex subunit Vps17 [Schizosaccharomyces pombe]|eukprot:NP_593047.1 retromer complex subunit Vps17 [Schizosaccharomyces pombe]
MSSQHSTDDLMNSHVFSGGFSTLDDKGFQDVPIHTDMPGSISVEPSSEDANVGSVNGNINETPVFEADRLIAEATMNPSAASSTTGENSISQTGSGPFLRIRIVDIEAENSKDPVIKMNVQTTLPAYRSKLYKNVRRTHAEFKKFAKYLISTHPECLIPAVPEAKTSVSSGIKEDLIYLKSGLQSWLNYVSTNPNLLYDPELQLFVESDYGYSPLINTGNPTSGLKRKALKQFPLPPDPCQALANLRPIVKSFYKNAKDAEIKLEKLVNRKQSLALTHADLGQSLIDYSVEEQHNGLANALNRVGKMLQAISDVRIMQSSKQLVTLADSLCYASDNAFVVKEILSNRHILMRDLISSKNQTNSYLSAANRLQDSPKISKARTDDALQALEVARVHEKLLSDKVDFVTLNLVKESKTYTKKTSVSLQKAIREYVEKEAYYERRLLSIMESIRPHIRNIDPFGGLSRLGREEYPRRLSNPPPSQKTNQDAWTNRKRPGYSSSFDGSSQSTFNPSNNDGAHNTSENADELVEPPIGNERLDPKSVANLLNAI